MESDLTSNLTLRKTNDERRIRWKRTGKPEREEEDEDEEEIEEEIEEEVLKGVTTDAQVVNTECERCGEKEENRREKTKELERSLIVYRGRRTIPQQHR